jgi:hypothetical protein
MSFNTLAPALMEDELRREIKTPFGPIVFTHHKPYQNCLWVDMHQFQGAELDVNTYITSGNLTKYGLMMTVRRKARNVGPKQKEYKLIELAMEYVIREYQLEGFDNNKH